MGSITNNLPAKLATYGASKAAINYIMRKVYIEEEWLTSMVIHPGWTQTDMGKGAAKTLGVGDDVLAPLEESIEGVVKEVSLKQQTLRFHSTSE